MQGTISRSFQGNVRQECFASSFYPMQSYIINITDGTTQTTHLAMIKIISIHAIGMDPPTDQYPNPGTVEVLALPNEWR